MTDLRKAAEMALEALEEAASCVQHSYLPDSMGHDWDEQIAALRQALAQPEQEPVAWADKVGAVIPHSHKLFQPDLLKDYTRPLYTAPPKKEWVGLTDADIAKAMHGSVEGSNMLPYQFARAIEQALKEKNT